MPSPFGQPPETGHSASSKQAVSEPFPYDRDFRDRIRPMAEFLYRRYWRVQVEGVEHVPAEGPAIVIANHSGGIPFDAVMLSAALEFDHPHPRVLRFLYDRFVAEMPFVAKVYDRLGAVIASFENAQQLLERGEAIGLFPEGVQGIAKTIGHRYELQTFHTGFVRLSLDLRVPIVPVVVVGAEEIYPLIGKWRPSGLLKELLNVPYIPLTPLFPLLGPFGAIPLPTHWRVHFDKPLHPYRYVPGHAGKLQVRRLSDEIRRQMQGRLHELLARRDTMFR